MCARGWHLYAWGCKLYTTLKGENLKRSLIFDIVNTPHKKKEIMKENLNILCVGDIVSVRANDYHFFSDTEMVKIVDIFLEYGRPVIVCVNKIGLKQRIHQNDIYNKVVR